MKKKVLTVIWALCIALVLTACSGKADMAEVEESAEADAKEEMEVEAKAQEEAEEQARLEEAKEYYEAGRKSLYGLDGAQVDMADAYTNFTKAQELGNIDANFYLGLLADDWYGYPKMDYEQARAYYEKSGDNPYAQIALGRLYYNGDGVKQDMKKGKKLFKSVADQGVAEGYWGLAAIAGNEEDFETALEYYIKVAEEGTEQLYITDSMIWLGIMYYVGDGVGQDFAKASEWFAKAADLGNADAMTQLGDMYYSGDGVEQDFAKASEWFAKAADLGNADAMTQLGAMYSSGKGVGQDFDKAIEWETKAADLGSADAMAELGYSYYLGKGVEQDFDKTIEWFTKAADLGQAEAMAGLGIMYYAGDGVEQDIDKAIEWLTKAADLGQAEAEEILEQLQGW